MFEVLIHTQACTQTHTDITQRASLHRKQQVHPCQVVDTCLTPRCPYCLFPKEEQICTLSQGSTDTHQGDTPKIFTKMRHKITYT